MLPLTDNERAKLAELDKQRTAEFDKIAALIATQLGYDSNPDKLADTDREAVAAEAKEAIARWDEDAEMADTPPELTTALRHLLSKHYWLEQEILNIESEAIERDIAKGP
jgi:hypothetical protein